MESIELTMKNIQFSFSCYSIFHGQFVLSIPVEFPPVFGRFMEFGNLFVDKTAVCCKFFPYKYIWAVSSYVMEHLRLS